MSILNQIDFDVPSSRNTSEFLDDESECLKEDEVKTLDVQVRSREIDVFTSSSLSFFTLKISSMMMMMMSHNNSYNVAFGIQ